MIEQLLLRRFGEIPNEIHTLLTLCTPEQLTELVNPALDATDLDMFVAYLPGDDESGGMTN